jgi:hypothetical protein
MSSLRTRLVLQAEPLVGARVLTIFGVIRSDLLEVLADHPPAFRVESFCLVGDKIVLAPCDGLDPELDMLGGKVEVRVEEPDARGLVPTPGEDAALVATELRAGNKAFVLESRADLLPGAGIPQPRGLVPTPGEDAALVATELRAVNIAFVLESSKFRAHNPLVGEKIQCDSCARWPREND